jgi:hypothetical protein
MSGVVTEVEQDIKNLCAHNPAQDNENPEIPGLFRIDALPGGVADTNPKSYEHTHGDEKSISGHAESADVKESGKHFFLDA